MRYDNSSEAGPLAPHSPYSRAMMCVHCDRCRGRIPIDTLCSWYDGVAIFRQQLNKLIDCKTTLIAKRPSRILNIIRYLMFQETIQYSHNSGCELRRRYTLLTIGLKSDRLPTSSSDTGSSASYIHSDSFKRLYYTQGEDKYHYITVRQVSESECFGSR